MAFLHFLVLIFDLERLQVYKQNSCRLYNTQISAQFSFALSTYFNLETPGQKGNW